MPTDEQGDLDAEAAAAFERLSADETKALRQRWREAFAGPVKRRHRVWVYRGYDWHAFSYGLTPSVSLQPALEAYRAAFREGLRKGRRREVYLMPEDLPAFRCRAAEPPDLSKQECLVCPEGLDWTMAFTHEDGWLGPFFSRRGWQAKP